MKGLFSFGLAAGLLCIPSAFAQGHGGYRTYGSPTGFGNVLFPGTGTAPPLTAGHTFPIAPVPPAALGPNHGQRLAGTIQGRIYPGSGYGGRGGRTVVVPYAYPVAVGGWGFGGYDYGGYGYPPQEPNVTIVQAAPQQGYAQQQPPVVINQYYSSDSARPVMKEYGPGASNSQSGRPDGMNVYESGGPKFPDPADQKEAKAVPGDDRPTLYLIAFKSGNISPALAFWVEDDTLHYITKDKSLNKASLSLIDRELSTQLNAERRVDFKLPAGK